MEYDISVYALPGFLLLITIELILEKVKKTRYYRLNDSFSSVALGITSKTSEVLLLSLGAWVIDHNLSHWQLAAWSADAVWVWVVTYLGYDCVYYWFHRCSHRVNFWWAAHVVHHQSEEFNLTTALRQSSTTLFAWVFSLPLLFLGVPLEVFNTCVAINILYMFWVHTRHVKNLGGLDFLLVSPAHHSVHHAQNGIYIDKNFGGTFIIWDRLFGSFQDELPDEAPVYGVRSPLLSFNPWLANVQVWQQLVRDTFYTKKWLDKIRIWIKPPGWRPQDVLTSMPLGKIDLTNFSKFEVKIPNKIKAYALLHLIMAFPFNLYFMMKFSQTNYASMLLYWIIATLPLVSVAMLLDGKSFVAEKLRLLFTLILLVVYQEWFENVMWWLLLSYTFLSLNIVWLIKSEKLSGVVLGKES